MPYHVTSSAGLKALQPLGHSGHWGGITCLTALRGSGDMGPRQGNPAETHPTTYQVLRHWQLHTVRRKLPKNYHIIVLLSGIIHRHFKCWTQMFAYMNSLVLRNSMWHSLSRLPPRLTAFWAVTKVSPRMSFWSNGDLGEVQEKGNTLGTHKINSVLL